MGEDMILGEISIGYQDKLAINDLPGKHNFSPLFFCADCRAALLRKLLQQVIREYCEISITEGLYKQPTLTSARNRSRIARLVLKEEMFLQA